MHYCSVLFCSGGVNCKTHMGTSYGNVRSQLLVNLRFSLPLQSVIHSCIAAACTKNFIASSSDSSLHRRGLPLAPAPSRGPAPWATEQLASGADPGRASLLRGRCPAGCVGLRQGIASVETRSCEGCEQGGRSANHQ
jgi:hypothetical protein